MPEQDDVEAYKATEKIEYLTAIGDQFTIGMLLNAQASIRENAPWLSLDMNTLGNLTEEEMDNRLKDVAKVSRSQSVLQILLPTVKETTSNHLQVRLNIFISHHQPV